MTPIDAGLEVFYVREEDWKARLAATRNVLGVVGYRVLPDVDADIPAVCTDTPPLTPTTSQFEIWHVPEGGEPVDVRAPATVKLRRVGAFSFGCVKFPGDGLPADDAQREGAVLHADVEAAYGQLLDAVDSINARLIRVWNFIPAINAFADGDERYRHFNSARRSAYDARRAAPSRYPAACALGSSGRRPILYFIATHGVHERLIENPRQVAPPLYPAQYGRDAPLFARACVMPARRGLDFLLSGTASIVGHETVHPGDPALQTRETMKNIQSVLQASGRVQGDLRRALQSLVYKVYVRHPEQLHAIAAELQEWLSPPADVLYLRADICREDLLVEIEATGRVG